MNNKNNETFDIDEKANALQGESSMDSEESVLSRKLRERHKELKLTFKQISELSGISMRMLFFYESGKSIPRSGRLKELAKAYQVEEKYLKSPDYMSYDEYLLRKSSDTSYSIGDLKCSKLIQESCALLAGGTLTPEQEDEFYREITMAYFNCKHRAATLNKKNNNSSDNLE